MKQQQKTFKEVNPFVSEARIKVIRVIEEIKNEDDIYEYFYLDPLSSENTGRRSINISHLYYKNLCMSSNAIVTIRFLNHLLLKLSYGSDVIDINPEKYIKDLQLTERVFRRERNKLITMGFLAKRVRKNSYFINPRIMWRGNIAKDLDIMYKEITKTKMK